MNTYHFCNVKREWDKVSKYIIDKCINNSKLSLEDKIKNIFIARIYNRLDSLCTIGYPKKKYNIKASDLVYKQNPSAYPIKKVLIRLMNKYAPGKSILEVANYLDVIFKDATKYTWDKSFREVYTNFCDILGFKSQNPSHIAYQCALDMSYLFVYDDINEWALLTPGAIKGLNIITYNSEDNEYSCCDFNIGEFYSGTFEINEVYTCEKEIAQECYDKEEYNNMLKLLYRVVKDIIPNVELNLQDVVFNLYWYTKWFSKLNRIPTNLKKYIGSKDNNYM